MRRYFSAEKKLFKFPLFISRFGIFGFGAYPLALELSVEASYPIDEAAGTAIIFLSGQARTFEIFLPINL